jgi:hypothetical protein
MENRKIEGGGMGPMEQAKSDRRRLPRWRGSGWLSGWIGDATKVSVVDISMGGVLIEHSIIFPPSTVCILTLSLCGARVSVKCRVVQSALYRYENSSVGERNYVYRTGLALVDVSEASEQLIGEYIGFLEAIDNGNSEG